MESMKPVLSALDSIIANVDNALRSADPANGQMNESSTGKKKKNKKIKNKAATEPTPPPSVSQFLQLDLRVGKILEVSIHTEKLYALKVSYGEYGERSVCAGLRGFVEADALKGRLFVTITNLKPRSLRGVPSQAMILAGSVVSDEVKEEVVPLEAPIGSEPGDIVKFAGLSGLRTVTEGKYVSSKNWERCSARLSVKNGQACYEESALTVNDKPVLCALKDGAEIH